MKILLRILSVNLQIGTNGYFTFKSFIGFTPFPFKRGNGLSLVAPFFTNIELPTGSVEYEVHTNNSINIATAINERINNTPNTTFCGEWFLIASWKKGEVGGEVCFKNETLFLL